MNMMPSRQTGGDTSTGKLGRGKGSSGGSTKGKEQSPGKAFEKRLAESFDYFQSIRSAVIRKIDPPTRVIRIKGKPVVIQLNSDLLDFAGARIEDGRMIVLEAKSTLECRLPFNVDKSGITKTQVKALNTWYWAGAVTGILWEVRDPEFNAEIRSVGFRVFFIPWARCMDMTVGVKRKSLTPLLGTELSPLFTGSGIHVDLRPVIGEKEP